MPSERDSEEVAREYIANERDCEGAREYIAERIMMRDSEGAREYIANERDSVKEQ